MKVKTRIIVALIGLAGVVVTAVLVYLANKAPNIQNQVIYLRDENSLERIPGYVFINNELDGIFIDSTGTPDSIPLAKGSHTIRAESPGYITKETYIDRIGGTRDITLKKAPEVPPVVEYIPPEGSVPLPLTNWYPYNRITMTTGRGMPSNEAILNTSGRLPEAAGIVNAELGTSLRGKTVILFFSNTMESDFNAGRMVKIEADGEILKPENADLNEDFLYAEDTPFDKGIEFIIPNTFNGKLEMIFFWSDINNLKIRAYTK